MCSAAKICTKSHWCQIIKNFNKKNLFGLPNYLVPLSDFFNLSSPFTSREYLTNSNCLMSEINMNTFTTCGNLRYFDASNNLITTVDGAAFKNCAALKVIDLTGNKFDLIS